MKKMLFNSRYGLEEAVLSGRKTQTRRIVSERLWDRWTDYDDFCNSVAVGDIPTTRQYYKEEDFFLDNSPYKVGEVVAVAQCYNDFYNDECDPRLFPSGAGWTNKMFVRADLMPHQIRITNVRVERLNDISEYDCLAEGVEIVESFYQPANGDKHHVNYYRVPIYCKSRRVLTISGDTPREAYAALIDRISGKGTWESNPWVFVYDFELVK